MFKFYLNGTEMNDHPDGWNEIASTIKRDETGVLLYDADVNLVSYGGQDMYGYLKNAWDTDKYGTTIINIEQRIAPDSYALIHSGTILHSDIKFNLVNGSMEYKSDDRSWFTNISNNKSIDITLDVSESKNKVLILPCPSFDLEVFNPQDGTYYTDKRKAYKIIDALKYMVRFLSDGKLTFQSSCFDTGGIYEGYCLVSGLELSEYGGVSAPRLSWGDLAEDLMNKLNIKFVIEGSSDNPVIRAEQSEDLFSGSSVFDISDVPDEIKLYVDTNLLYSTVEIGSSASDATPTLALPDVQSLISFKEEKLHFQGTNNIDRVFQLKGNTINSCAVIEICVRALSGYDSYNEDVFMIEYDPANNKAKQSNWTGTPGKYFYNESLTNINILNRFSNSFPNSVMGNIIDVDANRFFAWQDKNTAPVGYADIDAGGHSHEYASTAYETGPLQFDNDYSQGFFSPQYGITGNGYTGEDPSNNYGGATPAGSQVAPLDSYYTIPSDGLYTFNAGVYFYFAWNFDGLNPRKWRDKKIGVRFRQYRSGNLINYYDGAILNCTNGGNSVGRSKLFVSGSRSIYALTGDQIDVVLYHYVPGAWSDKWEYEITELTDSYFSCSGINIGGGILSASSPYNYKAMKIDFKYPLSLQEYLTIRGSKTGIIRVPLLTGGFIQGWINNLKYNHFGGDATFTLITDGNTVYR